MRFFSSFLLICLSFPGFAQLDNTCFKDSIRLVAADKNKLFLGFQSFSFLKNNEYFNPIADGYTLFGYQVQPTLFYQPSEKVVLQGGIFIRKDFGSPEFTQVEPVFSVKFKTDSLTVIFGNLQGHLNHRLIEPLFDFERVIQNRQEGGFQLLYHKPRFYGDLWIDWLRAITPASTFQERISVGFSSTFRLFRKEKLTVELPVQLQIFHQGGQIGTAVGPNTNWSNGAAGLSLAQQVHEKGFIRSFRLDNYLAVYYNFSEAGINPVFFEGFGLYFNALLRTRWFDVMGSYWSGYNFRALQGGSLYQSVKEPGIYVPPEKDTLQVRRPRNPRVRYFPDNYVPPPPGPAVQGDRELVIIRIMRDFKILPNLYITLRLEPFWTGGSRKMDFSHGFYVHYRQNFLLKTIKPPF
jgi:hypothetical protein